VERTFAAVRTTALRLLVTESNDHTYSRVAEFEEYAA
jgi:alpha-L-rhamnosidase